MLTLNLRGVNDINLEFILSEMLWTVRKVQVIANKFQGQIWPGKGPLMPDPFLGQTRPESQVRLTRNQSQKDIFDSNFVSVWARFRISLTQIWIWWPNGTLSGSNLTREFLECRKEYFLFQFHILMIIYLFSYLFKKTSKNGEST